MANFPHWINKKSSTASSSSASNLSPRQVANKAYSLAIKKLDRDDKRRRPHYTVRERLLLSNTMTKAEDLLNKRTPRSNRRVLASEFDDDLIICPPATHIPPPAPIQVQPQPQPQAEEKPATPASTITPTSNQAFQPLESKTPTTTANTPTEAPALMSSPALPSAEEIAVSLVVVAAVAYNSLVAATVNEQKAASFCRPMMIPSHSMTSFKTIV
ncbi:aminophospholipid translocase [Mucor velutinosus]|uniref:Aminophospholipid translocase n=1 Tax=Mucor velutinosus TaxID=708070 RepID=A0AAN7DBB9_9FUNG|nr:aminophospholipid translocase [Mucor velutinosus]